MFNIETVALYCVGVKKRLKLRIVCLFNHTQTNTCLFYCVVCAKDVITVIIIDISKSCNILGGKINLRHGTFY